FGEIALLADHPRTATVTATKPTDLIAVSREVISDLVALSPPTLDIMVRFLRDRLSDTLLATSPLFAPFSPDDRAGLAGHFRFLEVEPGQVLVEECKRSDGLYVIAAGSCEVARRGRRIAQLGVGELFGEMSLLTRAPAEATVRTSSKAYILQLP